MTTTVDVIYAVCDTTRSKMHQSLDNLIDMFEIATEVIAPIAIPVTKLFTHDLKLSLIDKISLK